MSQHKQLAKDTGVRVYFCDPQAPWERGTNENTNGLLRQYMPKRSPIGGYSQYELTRFARLLNRRPRKALGFATPEAVFSSLLR